MRELSFCKVLVKATGLLKCSLADYTWGHIVCFNSGIFKLHQCGSSWFGRKKHISWEWQHCENFWLWLDQESKQWIDLYEQQKQKTTSEVDGYRIHIWSDFYCIQWHVSIQLSFSNKSLLSSNWKSSEILLRGHHFVRCRFIYMFIFYPYFWETS